MAPFRRRIGRATPLNIAVLQQPVRFILRDSNQRGEVHGAQGWTGNDARGVRCLVGRAHSDDRARRKQRGGTKSTEGHPDPQAGAVAAFPAVLDTTTDIAQ